MKKILVAEDDFPSRELLTEILTEWGYEVVPASNGLEALQQIEKALPDLVLLDIQMPLLDGFGVIERLRKDPRFSSLRVVALTAHAMREDRQRTGHAGFDAHISKPVDLATLRALIEQSFRVRRDSQESGSEETPAAVGVVESEHGSDDNR
jgi:CheY-like chemotaxis protein